MSHVTLNPRARGTIETTPCRFCGEPRFLAAFSNLIGFSRKEGRPEWERRLAEMAREKGRPLHWVKVCAVCLVTRGPRTAFERL